MLSQILSLLIFFIITLKIILTIIIKIFYSINILPLNSNKKIISHSKSKEDTKI